VHSAIQEVRKRSRIVTALVLKFAGAEWDAVGCDHFIDFLLMLNTLVKHLHSLKFLVRLQGHIHNCFVQEHSRVQ